MFTLSGLLAWYRLEASRAKLLRLELCSLRLDRTWSNCLPSNRFLQRQVETRLINELHAERFAVYLREPSRRFSSPLLGSVFLSGATWFKLQCCFICLSVSQENRRSFNNGAKRTPKKARTNGMNEETRWRWGINVWHEAQLSRRNCGRRNCPIGSFFRVFASNYRDQS